MRTSDIAQNIGRNPMPAQQQPCAAEQAGGKEYPKGKAQDGADLAPLASGFACRTQPGTCHRDARQAPGIAHQINRVDQPVYTKAFCAGIMAEQHTIEKAEGLQGNVAACKHTRRV